METIYHHHLIPNTFGIEARCRSYIDAVSVDDVVHCVMGLSPSDAPLLTIGGGSNLLFTQDFPGTVIHVSVKGVECERQGDSVLVRVGAGETWDDFVNLCVDCGWYGAENLSFIPGEVGASAVQNIGAYGVEVKDLVDRVEVVEVATGRRDTFTNEACAYAYRKSNFKTVWKGKYIVTHVTYRLSLHFVPHLDYGNIREELERHGIAEPTARQLREAIIRIRKQKLPDPKVEGSAGSFFMNPVVDRTVFDRLVARYPQMPHYEAGDGKVKIPAGWMIDRCGWKGRTLGNAGVHDRQALVLVNRGGATGAEVLELCTRIRDDVKAHFGIDIQPEVNIF